jgi:peptide/nickel transport system substrate-binding protein
MKEVGSVRGQRSIVKNVVAACVFGGVVAMGWGAGGRHVVAASRSASPAAQTLTLGWSLETKTLDPVANAGNSEEWVQVNIFDQLVRVGGDGNSLVPDLATRWTISPNGLTYTFFLRKNAMFSNGQPVKAADVKFCLDRARGAKELWSWTLAAIKRTRVINASTLRITLKHRWAPFLSDLSLVDGGVYPEAYYKQVGASYLATHPIGTGPYMLKQWKKGQFILLQKNPHYWAAGTYPMQYVEYEVIPNDNTRLLKAEAGDLDVDIDLPANLASNLKGNRTVGAKFFPSTRTIYLIPNLKTTPLADVKVRQAINHAIDRRGMVKAILHGYGTPANSFMPRGAVDYDPNIPVPSYDMALAKKLMAESSHPKGFTLPMTVGAGDLQGNETAVIFKNEVAPLGINVQIRQMDPTAMLSAQEKGNFTFTTNQWTNDISDPDELVAFAVDYSAGDNSWFSYYNNPTITKLSHRAETTINPAQRKQLYYRIQQIWANDSPYYALYYPLFIDAVSTKVHGFSQIPLGYFQLKGVTKS